MTPCNWLLYDPVQLEVYHRPAQRRSSSAWARLDGLGLDVQGNARHWLFVWHETNGGPAIAFGLGALLGPLDPPGPTP